MKTTFTPWIKTVKLLAVLLVSTLTGWLGSRYHRMEETPEVQAVANENARRRLDDVNQQLAESRRKTDEAARKLAEVKPLLEGQKKVKSDLDKKREELLKQIKANSFEFTQSLPKRTSWNGQTDPDSVWHDQRRDANRTLIQHGLPTLEGRGAFPDSAPLSRSIPGLNGQK